MSSFLEAIRDKRAPAVGYDLMRVYLGVGLFARGVLFVAQPERILALTERSESWAMPMLLGHYVGIAHLGGGLMLILGIGTRFAAIIQIPILLGAVFLVHWEEGLLNPSQSLELAGLVLAMLVSYAVFGAGPISLDARWRQGAPAGTAAEPPPVEDAPAALLHPKHG